MIVRGRGVLLGASWRGRSRAAAIHAPLTSAPEHFHVQSVDFRVGSERVQEVATRME